MSGSVLQIRNLEVAFRRHHGLETVVDGVSFDLNAGEIVALVGESGCGKSVTAQALLGLLPPQQATISADHYLLAGKDLTRFSGPAWRSVRGQDLAMVFQQPATALDPVFTIGQQLIAVIRRSGKAAGNTNRKMALEALGQSGFPEPGQVFDAYPHQLSGGMRQLVMIAMAMSVQPRVLIADEPTTALDVSTQALVIDRLARLAGDGQTAVLLVTHDLGVAARICSRAMVMYCGRLVEQASYSDLYNHPRHHYTAGLFAAVPRIVEGIPRPVRAIEGKVPALSDMPAGCRFAARCASADDLCRDRYPATTEVAGDRVACHHPL